MITPDIVYPNVISSLSISLFTFIHNELNYVLIYTNRHIRLWKQQPRESDNFLKRFGHNHAKKQLKISRR